MTFSLLLIFLASCELVKDSQSVQSSDATLSSILVVSRPESGSGDDDYVVITKKPDFHPDSLFYSVEINTAQRLGVRPVTSFPEASFSVAVDGESVTATRWKDDGEFFACTYKSGVENRKIDISVTAEDGSSKSTYTINVHYTYDSLQEPPDSLYEPSSDATLSDILTVLRQYNSDSSTDVTIKPDFNPETHSYSIQIPTGNMLGVRPVTTSSKAILSFTIDREPVTAEKHVDSNDIFYWVNKRSRTDYAEIEISVIAEDKKSRLTYSIKLWFYTDTLNEPPANLATLSDLLTVARIGNSSYSYLNMVTPDFRPDSLSYSVELDSTWTLGVQPILSSPKASISVLLDGIAINPEEWSESAKFFTCTPSAETNERTIEINVTAEDEESRLTYLLAIKRMKTHDPCLLDDMPMAKWISDTMITCGSRCGNVVYFGIEEVGPSPKFASDSFEYLVHIGDFNFFGFTPIAGDYIAEFTVQSTADILKKMHGSYYYLERPTGSKETDTIKITVDSTNCETPSIYTIIVAP